MSKDNFDPTKPFGIGNGITEYNAQEAKPEKAPAKRTRAQVAQADEGAEDPVADMNATDAVEAIGRMRSKEKVQAIVDGDQRATVKAAAEKRLAELG
jgi:hypothetical protein